MTFRDLVDFARVLGAFAAVFVVLPWLAWASRGIRRADSLSRLQLLVRAFIGVSLWLELTGLLLGTIRLCLPGATLASYGLWMAGGVLWRGQRGRRALGRVWPRAVLRLMGGVQALATKPWRLPAEFWKRRWIGGTVAAITMVLLLTLAQRLSFPLNNAHFARMESYARAISLQVLTHGDQWVADGSVALLAPVVFLSGVSAAEVLRFAGPLWATLLAAAVAWSTYRWTRRGDAAVVSCALAALLPLLAQGGVPAGEAPASQIAALYVVLALGWLPDSRRLSLASLLVGLLIDWRFAKPAAWLAACGGLGFLVAWLGRRLGATLRMAVSGLMGVGFVAVTMFQLDGPRSAGPYQYEAAARVAGRIAREFPRNEWMIISPSHELAAVYGRGWHLELLKFTSAFGPAQVSEPSFSFPYTVQHLFIFVEKQPLWPGDSAASEDRLAWLQPGPAMDPAVWAYHSPLGRATIQYEAAEVLAAYRRTHHGVKTYYEDARLVVYHLERGAPGET